MTSSARARSRRRNAAGFNLIETLLGLVIISVLIVALIQGLLTSSTATYTTSRSQLVNSATTSYSEALKQLDYEPCADPSYYTAKYNDLLASVTDPAVRARLFGTAEVQRVQVTSVRYWSPGTFPLTGPTVPGQYVSVCAEDGGSQLLTFEVDGEGLVRQGQAVKRNALPGAFTGAAPTTTAGIPGNTPPIASFTAAPGSGPAPLTVSFNGAGSADVDGAVTSYAWDYGDGTTDTGQTAAHVFGPGTFTVRLVVTDNMGASSVAARQTISVTGTPPVPTGLTKVRDGCCPWYVNFTWSSVVGVSAYEVEVVYCTLFCWVPCASAVGSFVAPTAAGQVQFGAGVAGGLLVGCSGTARIRARVGGTYGAWSPTIGV